MKFSREMLNKMILEEAAKLRATKTIEPLDGKALDGADPKATVEIDADEYATSVKNAIDWCAAAKIKEARLLKQVKLLREKREIIMKKISSKKGK